MVFNKEDMIDFFINDFDSVIGENIIDFAEDLERLDFIEINEPNGSFYYELDIDSEKTDALGQFIDYFDTIFLQMVILWNIIPIIFTKFIKIYISMI